MRTLRNKDGAAVRIMGGPPGVTTWEGLSGKPSLYVPISHSHQSDGAQGGKLDHGLALTGLTDDDHTQYVRHALATAENDFLVAPASGSFVKKTLAEAKTILGVGSSDPGEGHVTILPWHYSGVTAGTWDIVIGASQVFNAFLFNSSNAQNDRVDYKAYLGVGTYTFSLLTLTTSTSAILTLLIDGVSQGTIDQYSATVVWNVIKSITGIVVAEAGIKTVSLKAVTRNASNTTGWYLYMSSMALYRTA